MYDVSIHLLCTKKSGTLSRIIREIKLFGLQYQSHDIKFGDNQTRIVINSNGDLNCSVDALEEMFSSLAEVVKVEKLEVSRDGRDISQFKIAASETRLSAKERITPAVVLAAEKRLSEILGPISAFIVESNAPGCRNAGELYARLAEELSDQKEREYFLTVIEDD